MIRSRSEYVEQLLADIASYYGYNDVLAEKLFLLFPVEEVMTYSAASSSFCLTQLPCRP